MKITVILALLLVPFVAQNVVRIKRAPNNTYQLPTYGGVDGSSNQSHRGEFLMPNGARYALIFDYDNSGQVYVDKSTDGGATWTLVGGNIFNSADDYPTGTHGAYTAPFAPFAGFQLYTAEANVVGTQIWLFGSTDITNTNRGWNVQHYLGYYQFETAGNADIWLNGVDGSNRYLPTQITALGLSPGSSSTWDNFTAASLYSLVKANGNVVVVYCSDFYQVAGQDMGVLSAITWNGTSWGTPQEITGIRGSNLFWTIVGLQEGPTGREHYYFFSFANNSQNFLYHISRSSGSFNTLQLVTNDVTTHIEALDVQAAIGQGVFGQDSNGVYTTWVPYVGGGNNTLPNPEGSGPFLPEMLNYVAYAPDQDNPTYTLALFDNTREVGGTDHNSMGEVILSMALVGGNLNMFAVSVDSRWPSGSSKGYPFSGSVVKWVEPGATGAWGPATVVKSFGLDNWWAATGTTQRQTIPNGVVPLVIGNARYDLLIYIGSVDNAFYEQHLNLIDP